MPFRGAGLGGLGGQRYGPDQEENTPSGATKRPR
jgi:hypothetical protein